MYKNHLVLAVKHAGKILREFGDEVRLPFGSEYSLHLQNINTVRASVSVSIDGEDVMPGHRLVLDPGQSVDLERYIRAGNLEKGNRFKFIERSARVEAHRGIRAADGLVQVAFQFECAALGLHELLRGQAGDVRQQPWPGGLVGGPLSDVHMYGGVLRGPYFGEGPRMAPQSATAFPQGVPGITVPGSQSDQAFHVAGPLSLSPEKYNLVLKLTGELGAEEGLPPLAVTRPVTVKDKPRCTICGKKNPSRAKFCSECGASLVLY